MNAEKFFNELSSTMHLSNELNDEMQIGLVSPLLTELESDLNIGSINKD